jgi:formylglycine-generating enzyme required for sulfatase activity
MTRSSHGLQPSDCIVALGVALVACARIDSIPPHMHLPPACSPSDGMVRIEGGGFYGHHLDPFYMDRTEVTGASYYQCVRDGACSPSPPTSGCTPHTPLNPVSCVRYSEAKAYCKWRGARLPTALEWTWAAQGRELHLRYPWGRRVPSCAVAVVPARRDGSDPGCGKFGTWPVGSKPDGASRDGVLDLIGNVSEWAEPTTKYGLGVIMGGGWSSGAFSHVGAYEIWEWDHASAEVGFRCVRDTCDE